MKHILTALIVLFLAAPLMAGEFPVEYECKPDNELEKQFCDGLEAALLKTGYVTYEAPHSSPFFYVVALPVVRDGYISAAIAANFVYPPFRGLALSAFTGGYLVMPDLLDDQVTNAIAEGLVTAVSEWMIYAEPRLNDMGGRKPVILECSNDDR